MNDPTIPEEARLGWPIRFWLAMLTFGCVFPMVLLAIALIFSHVDRHRIAVLDQARDTARALTLVVDRELSVRTATLIVLSGSQALSAGDLVRFRQSAIAAVARTSPENEVLVVDARGRVVMTTEQGISSPQIAAATEFERALASGKPHVSNLFADPESGRYLYAISVPMAVGGENGYVLVKKLKADAMTRILSQQKLPDGWFAAVFDRTTTVVGRNKNADRFTGKHASRGLYEGMRTGGPEGTVESETLEGVGVFSNWSRSPISGWSVAVAVPRRHFTGLLLDDLAVFGTLSLAMLALSVAVAWRVGDRIALAIRRVAEMAKSLAAGIPAIPLPSGILEVGEVQIALSRTSAQLDENRQSREKVVSDLKAADERQRVLIAELDHRAKNMLATVQSIARRSLPNSESRARFDGRLLALARAHNELAATGWRGASLRKLLSAEAEAFVELFVLNGPDLPLNPKTAQSMSLIVHELTTNAAKYGSLSVPDGSVNITWQVETAGEGHVRFVWTESGGPPVRKPERIGFGRTLIERSATHDLEGSIALDFRPEGVVCTLILPMHDIALTSPAPEPERSQQRPAARPVPVRKRLLICEDEALVALDLTDAFESIGYEVVGPASRVDEALRLVRENDFDGGVLDVNLNGEMIFPVAEVLRSRGIPFVFSTGYGDQANFPPEFRTAPHVSKPFDHTMLLAAVDELFQDAEASAN